MAEDPAMQADRAGADLHLLAALSAVWSEPLQRLYDQSPNARQMLDFVMVKNRSLGFGGTPAAPWTRKMDVAAATLRRRLRVLAAARSERRRRRLAERARARARRDASGWSKAHEALEHLSPDRACARTLPEVLAALRDHADGGGRIVEGEAESHRLAAEAVDDADDADEADDAGDAAGDDASAPPPAPPAQGLGENVLWTKHALAWLDGAEAKRRAMCVARVARVAAGDWTYATAKPLKGATRRRLLEAKLDRGWRILWELRRDRVVVVWFVVPHDAISRRARQIDAAELRSARPLGDGDDEEVPLDPLGNTPLCCYAVRRDDLARLVAGDWTPPMALTAPERAVVVNDAPSATLLLGRSGTGKTICTVSRMLLDAERYPGETRVFVARSRRLVDHVGRMLRRHGDDKATLATLDDFVAGLAAPATYEPRRRVGFPRFRDDLWPRAATKGGGLGDALTAWTQIRSFLKGSAEAVVKGAALDEAEFLAEAFNNRTRLRSADDRRDACRIRARYDRELADRGLWDDAGRARAVAARLLADRGARAFDRVYVDEVQDSTQAELMVLALACGGDAARLWLAGDTAQAVTYGVHFRFAEVRSALYHCRDAGGAVSRPPPRVTKLTANYRAHGGVLDVAAAVLDALLGAFPEALDKLPRDEAMARGPRPAVAVGDEGRVAALLAADERYVVVAHDEQRDALRAKFPEPTTILGVRDAKGLEFSHVIAYGLVGGAPSAKAGPRSAWAALFGGAAAMRRFGPLPLQLEAELMLLYTGITRCRTQLLFCEAKTPAGGAFARWLLDRDLAEKFTPPRDNERVFLTRDEWRARAADLADRGLESAPALLLDAAKAFERAGDGAAAAAARGAHAAAALADGADDGAVAAAVADCLRAGAARDAAALCAEAPGDAARECRLAILQRCMVGDEARDAADALRDILDLDAQLDGGAAATEYLRVTWDGGDGSDQYGATFDGFNHLIRPLDKRYTIEDYVCEDASSRAVHVQFATRADARRAKNFLSSGEDEHLSQHQATAQFISADDFAAAKASYDDLLAAKAADRAAEEAAMPAAKADDERGDRADAEAGATSSPPPQPEEQSDSPSTRAEAAASALADDIETMSLKDLKRESLGAAVSPATSEEATSEEATLALRSRVSSWLAEVLPTVNLAEATMRKLGKQVEDDLGVQLAGKANKAWFRAEVKKYCDELVAAEEAREAREFIAGLAPPREHLLQSAADGIVSLESFGFTERSVHRAERQILFGVRAPDTSTLDCRACGRIMLPEKFSNREIKRKQGARCKDCQAADLLARPVYSDDKFFDGPLGVLANLMETGGVPMNEDYQRIIGYGVNAARLKTEPVAPWYVASAESLRDLCRTLVRVADFAFDGIGNFQTAESQLNNPRTILHHCMHALANLTSRRLSVERRKQSRGTDSIGFTCCSDSDDSDVEVILQEPRLDETADQCTKMIFDGLLQCIERDPLLHFATRLQEHGLDILDCLPPLLRVFRNTLVWIRTNVSSKQRVETNVRASIYIVDWIFSVLGTEIHLSADLVLEALLLLHVILQFLSVPVRGKQDRPGPELVDVISDTAREYALTPFGTEIARYALICLPRLSASAASLDHKPRVAELVCDLLEGKIERPLDDTRASASRNPELRIAAVHAAGELLEIPGRTGYKELFLERRLDDTLVNIMTEYDRELADDELPSIFESARAGPEAAPRRRCLDLSKMTRLHALPTAELLPTLEALGWFVTRGPKPGFLVYHRPRGPSRRYAHRKIGQTLDEYGEPSIENPNFFETLAQVRKYLELHGADGVTKTGDIDEAPLTFRREDANEITDCFDPKVWSTEVTAKVDAIDRAHKLGSIFAKLECVLSKLRPKRWIPLQMHLAMAFRSGNPDAFSDLLAVLQPGPAHLAMHSLPPRRLKQHLARVLQGAASFLDRGLRHEHLPRIIELVVNDIAMIISARAPESRPLLKLWVDVAQKAAKGKDAHDSFPTAAATLVASSLRFAKSIGFQGDDDLSSRLITTAGLALRSGRADALAAYQQNDGPKLVAAAEAAGGAGKIAATVFSRYLARAAPRSTDGATNAPPALPATVKCADCSVTAGLCEYAGSKGESFHLCPGCYRYRVTENPAAKFKRVSGAPDAEDRKAADDAACETSVVDFENRRMLATLARLNCDVSPSTKTILREEMIDLDALIVCKPKDYAEIGIGAMDQHRLFSIQPTLMKMKESGEGPWELS